MQILIESSESKIKGCPHCSQPARLNNLRAVSLDCFRCSEIEFCLKACLMMRQLNVAVTGLLQKHIIVLYQTSDCFCNSAIWLLLAL